ncbi:MFS transporter [Amycolatopsis sp. GM8]|uniref:MFS transporter n=1 Tax=Amycolatopsis sp. GM8 TaxID=2896530 RepID=UPI001F4552B9|nr:MFS transporter [Amycolatopsis sp. GM8]
MSGPTPTTTVSGRTFLLAGGAFAVGTSAYIVAGVLPQLSSGLGVSVSAAGQLATAFALAYAIGAPLVATATGHWNRRTLLVVALLTAAAGNVLTAVAPTYWLVLLGRVVAALGAAAYTPAATLVATHFHPPHQRGRAVAIVFAGLTLALALGVPAGTILGGPLGYRGVFILVAGASVLAALGTRLMIPSVEAPAAVPLRERLAVAANPRLQAILVVTVLGVLSSMSVYTYVVPLLGEYTHATGALVSALLLVYGLGGLIGNLLGGRATDRFGSRPTLYVALAVIVLVLATLPLTLTTIPGAVIALFGWSLSTWGFNPPFQHLLLDTAGEQGGLALALNASAIYLGSGLSGVIGGLVIASIGITTLPLVGAALTVVTSVVFVVTDRRLTRSERTMANTLAG